ncbi:Piso0_001686 [Millerozyma farinosa CBS 7064]|uniref:Piso0_001686 protein n=1 Tax=Pichia sorbitophila (strain ATCC MYA-4447 / BCRC 22081 / CBS 7064 / NBRC 10061 / NRRL Y-12695) TaxID=559304 RepID=G8YLG2_PICSO|nr:Piso0_001686 [Millerozyma farinosa CBS 7064]
MAGSIVRCLNWDIGYDQRFLQVSPTGDEVVLHQLDHGNENHENQGIIKVGGRSGFNNIQCSNYSHVDIGVAGVGQLNGVVYIFDVSAEGSSSLQLSPKLSRPCNSLSFNNNGLVAVGFDKGRQDSSLQVWDIQHYSRAGSNDHISRPTYTYMPNEAILSCNFYLNDSNSLLSGSYKFLREVDLRAETPVFQMATKLTLGITSDPFQEHLFSSYNEDGSLAIWDRRKLTTNFSKNKTISGGSGVSESPVLYFNRLFHDSTRKTPSPCFRYSTIRRNEFAAVFNGNVIRRWQTGLVPAVSESRNAAHRGTKDGQTLASLKQQSSELYHLNEDSLFVASVLDVKTDYERVVSFDYSPDISSPTSTNLVCMRQSGSIFKMPVVECIESLDLNSYNEFTLVGAEGSHTKFLDDKELGNYMNSTKKVIDHLDFPMDNHGVAYDDDIESTVDDDSVAHHDTNGRKASKEDDEFFPLNTFLGTTDILSSDICFTIRSRAAMGYGFNTDKNIKILEKLDGFDRQLYLRHIWRWLGLAKKSLEKGSMISYGIDLGYMGVLGIWKGASEINDQNRYSNEISHVSDEMFSQAVKSIVASKSKKMANNQIPSNSQSKAQRKLCLIVSGWYLNDDEFEEKLNLLLSMGQTEKAAGWLVFFGEVDRAISVLASSKKERLRLIATAVAGYLAYKTSNVNSPWKDQCRKMASELDNPYLRAIFAFIADNDWWDVLDEHSLPLRERLGVALRFLSDKDLNVYLNRVAENVIAKGELEGLILTGITPQGMDLLQSYVDRTSDVQTASLIAAVGCPRYFTDPRFHHWVDCYRTLLNSWGMFSVRARFDISRIKLSRTYYGHLTSKPPPKQVYLQCTSCGKNISKPKMPNSSRTPAAGASASSAAGVNTSSSLFKQFTKMNLSKNFHDFKSCPHCGAPLPRCSICLLTLGSSIVNPPPETSTAISSSKPGIENSFANWFTFCLSCNHGCHAHHAEEWFSKHYVCPVPDCSCRCNSI